MSVPLGALLEDRAPDVSIEDAQGLASELFGVNATARPLGGERDRNFRICESSGRQWVLKVVHPAEDPRFTDLQSQALLHIAARDPGFPVPRVRFPLHGTRPDALWQRAQEISSPTCRVRMYSFLPGVPMHLTESNSTLRRHLGEMLARLDLALQDLRHPGETHELAWDAQHVDGVSDLLGDSDQVARRAVSHFVDHAAPQLAGLGTQLIHNDFNPHNVLTPEAGLPRVTGIIDFGDMVRGPVVQDLATAAAYQVSTRGDHPLTGPAEVAVGFHAACPLRDAEVELLFDLILARLVLILAITRWRARKDPGNRDYILRNSKAARTSLQLLAGIGCHDARDFFRAALEM